MGPQGCGKSSFINLAVGQPDCMTSADSRLCTQLYHSCERSRLVDGCEFRFTDTPGFGNEMIEDRKILELLIGHLVPSSDIDRSAADNSDFPTTQKIAGILYLYSEDEPFKSRTCRKTIEMLVKVLGKRFLDRVTVLIRSQNKSWIGIDFSNFIPDEDSPLYPLYCNNTKPRTISYERDPQSIERILGPYTRLRPRTIQLAALDHFAQQYGDHWRRNDIPRYLREFFPQDIGPPRLVDQLQSVLQLQTSELKGLRTLLAQREEDMRGVQISHDLEFSNIRNERERERIDHQFQLKYLHDTLRSRAREEAAELVSSQKFEIKDLRGLLSQKGEEIQNLRSKHDVELKKIQKDREKEIHDHGLGLKRLYNTIQEQEVEISELKSKTAPGKVSETKGLQGQLGAKDQEITKLKAMNQDINKLKLENDSEIKRLRALLSQKEEEIKGLWSTHETERELFREERANNQVALKVLQHKVEDREAEITQLKSGKDLQAEKLEALGNKIKKLDSEKDSEIERLQQLLVQGEMQDLASGRGIGLKNVQKFAHEIELNCKHLLEAIGEGFSNPESSTDLNLGEVETMAGYKQRTKN
ncbi:unnamed protein product [Rhizoctonia solani]|uniref:Uncharacterized protein n=1 Tax=Rhizoctonia solani TaxID=456999 RepID=A0A8H3I4H5_9AGAM|nr:unnamed protein product [Rhizoctonia solani]